MPQPPLDRRDFSRLSIAALGGAWAGATALAQSPPRPIVPPPEAPTASKPSPPPSPKPDNVKPDRAKSDGAKADQAKTDGTAPADSAAEEKPGGVTNAPEKRKADAERPKEIHICRGLNTCKGRGKSGTNKCAGRGDCATTLNAPHECATGNACKGQGGCGPTAGKNQCAGYGDGCVPLLEDEEWPRLRREFEYRMKRLRRPIGPAPPSENEVRWQRRWEEANAEALAEIEEAKKAEAQKKAAKKDNAKKGNAAKPKESSPKTKPDDNVKALDDLTGDKDKK